MTFRVVSTGEGYQEGALSDALNPTPIEKTPRQKRISFAARIVRRIKKDAVTARKKISSNYSKLHGQNDTIPAHNPATQDKNRAA